MKRREFIKKTAIVAGAMSISPAMAMPKIVVEDSEGKEEEAPRPLIDSEPLLQNYAEASMGVAFSVSALANGFVIYGEAPDLSDGVKVWCGGFRVTDMNADVMQVRLTGLKPATKYYYKIGADRIHFGGGYDIKVLETVIQPKVYSFTTAGKDARSHFCVINDTHAKWPAFGMAVDKVAELNPACVIWNGDACNVEETVEEQKTIFFHPEVSRKDYAANIPYAFCMGNHEDRGMANRHIERMWMYRQPEERLSRDWDLGRNFAVRMGDIAIIGLDTAEDKQDTNPKFANLFNSQTYRRAQVAWLEDVLKRPDIKKAPFLVAFCHIPLFDEDPTANPGDVEPDDYNPQYVDDYAEWQRTCARLWTPLLEKAGCQLVITAHQHRYRYDDATKERPWVQIVGGGPEMGEGKPWEFPTVIEGEVQDGRLRIRVHNLRTKTVVKEVSFPKKK